MNENNNNKGRGVFYGVIGVATLVVAIIGATFAYFTAAQSAGNGVIAGNMASIGFDLVVTKVKDPDRATGMIPMSNSMIEPAISKTSGTGACTDDVGNAVCQIYKITITNNSSAAMLVDGYVAITGGSGVPTDATLTKNTNNTMRWAQVFCTEENDVVTSCTTIGNQPLASSATSSTTDPASGGIQIGSLDAPTTATTTGQVSDTTGFNTTHILTAYNDIVGGTVTINGNPYEAVNTNFIRISDHDINPASDGQQATIKTDTEFKRETDMTSMLVINQQLGSSGGTGYQRDYYFVVWLSETGTNQTAGAGGTSVPTTTANPFFNGIVRFISAQGSEVTATFSGYTAVSSTPTTP